MRCGLLAFSGDDSFSIRAIPHKERTAKRSGKRYNKEVKKQLTMSLISDELGAGINEEEQRDPEAHSVKKGNQWYFGYKEHIGVDADSGLVHTVETTSANVHDSNMVAELLQGAEEDVYGDSGYLGAEKKDDAILVNNEEHPIRYQINKRPSQLKKTSGEKFELLKAIEHAKSSVRSKVEHVFCVINHFCKTQYRGREKLHQHCCTLFALANLYLARNRMKVA